MLKKLRDLIQKDVNNDNEVKMYAVIMRVLLVIFICYTLIECIMTASLGQYGYLGISVGCLAVSTGLMCLTYRNNTKAAVYLFQIMIMAVIFLNGWFYGTESGASQLIYVQIVMIFAIDYQTRKSFKVISTVGLIIYRAALYAFFRAGYLKPMYSQLCSGHWQSVHTVACAAMLITVIVISTADFTDMRKKLQNTNFRLRDVAGRDPLTGLYNRRSTQVYLEQHLEDFMKGTYTAITVVMADVDHFKIVNDTYGHDNGDVVLTSLANVMGAFMRDKGVACRWGGEEFVLVFVDHNGDDTFQLLTELQQKIAGLKFRFNDTDVSVSLTFGVAEQGGDKDVEATIKEADDKLYIGKNKGRNIIIY